MKCAKTLWNKYCKPLLILVNIEANDSIYKPATIMS